MIGRQGLHLDHATLQRNLSDFGLAHLDARKILADERGYAEPFLKALGATEVDSLDASEYEGAGIIHDMNLPIAERYRGAYDTVVDGGSLEHIFNFPVAMKNCMEMIKVNGFFLGITPTNNFLGHGFYQFSPELYFRVLSKENGFHVHQLLFFIDKPGADWFEVKDADEVRQRVTLSNSYPSYLFIMAKKIAQANVFGVAPQQSDYQNMRWKQDPPATPRKRSSLMTRIFRRIDQARPNWSANLMKRIRPTGDGDGSLFRKMNTEDKGLGPN